MILSKYMLIGGAALLLVSNTMTGCVVRKHYVALWEAEKATAKIAAEQERNRLNEEYRALERKAAETATALEASYDKIIATERAGAADRERDYARRLRALANRTDRCPAPSTPADSPVTAGDTGGGSDRLPEEIGRDIAALGESANQLAALVREVCIPWARSVGR